MREPTLFHFSDNKKLSIRKCADNLNKNRGSIEYEQKKLLGILAGLLMQRDEADGISRLNQEFDYFI